MKHFSFGDVYCADVTTAVCGRSLRAKIYNILAILLYIQDMIIEDENDHA